MENSATDLLSELLRTDRLTAVVDIGANPIDGDPPYKQMLSSGLCNVVGFEPQSNALAVLNKKRGPRETYFPYAIGDGNDQTLYICRANGMTSLLPPDPDHLVMFNEFSELGQVEKTVRVHTKRLDDVSEIEAVDFLKMDVQGAELQILKSGKNKLSKTVVIQTEISFVTLYQGQPTFGALDSTLRDMGFMPHAFAALKHWPIAPMVINENPRMAMGQLLEADLVYVRNFSKSNSLESEQWNHLAMVMHYCYRSFDLTLRCIEAAVELGSAAPGASERYLKWLQVQAPRYRWGRSHWSK